MSETLIARLLSDRSPETRARTALRCGERTWTYAELDATVQAGARALAATGVGLGDRVMMVLPNAPDFVVTFLAATTVGAIAVPVDFMAGPERLEFIAADTSPRVCLIAPGRQLPAGFPAHPLEVILAEGRGGVEFRPLESAGTTGPNAFTERSARSPGIDGDTDAVILYSAGSTGRPKGSILRHAQLLRIARTLVEIVGMDADHRELILAPMTHSGGWQRVTSTMLAGGCVVIPPPRPVTVPAVLEDVRDHEIHGFFAAPPLLRALLKTEAERVREALRSLRSIESASAPLAPSELRQLLDLLPDVRVLWQYGLTECSRALILDARARPDKLHTVGLPTPGVEVAIASEDGETRRPGEPGEILLDAPQRARRYWNRSDMDRERFRGRWLRTGDIGTLDDEGFVTYLGREDDMINCGGLSYFPAEAERELGSVPGVVEYIIAGVPDPKGMLEQVPWAFVVPEAADGWMPSAFARVARDRLPPHMVPRNIVVIPSMPLIASGKPDRRTVVGRHGPAGASR